MPETDTDDGAAGKLLALQISVPAPKIVRASKHRLWMHTANARFPYRCLPLVMANQLGWDVLNPTTFTVTWNGGPAVADVRIDFPGERSVVPQAHFGAGTFTMTLGHLFRTPPGVALLVMGPPNWPLDGICPLAGVVETDWSPATFTQNFRITRPGTFVVEAGVPYCRLVPIDLGLVERVDPELRMLDEFPGEAARYKAWSARRDRFNRDLKVPGSEAAKAGWQKDYFKGGGALAEAGEWPAAPGHRTKLNHREFADRRPADGRVLDQEPALEKNWRPFAAPAEKGATPIWVLAGLPGRAKSGDAGGDPP